MKIDFKIIMLSALLLSTLPAAAQTPKDPVPPPPEKPAYIKYAHNDAEYSVLLPEGPVVETIWGDSPRIPYLENPPKSGNLGEYATFNRVDMETDDVYDVKITFLKADQAFLDSLVDSKVRVLMDKDFAKSTINRHQYSFTAGENQKLKWATLTGFSVDRSNQAFFEAEHFLTGLQTITVIRVKYSVQNEKFGEYYRQMMDHIEYHPL